jgi:hypothetical protein
VPINPTAGLDVEFDLIFEDKGLSCIITYIYHPSAVYLENPNGSRLCSVQIEATSNFILWLLGKPHDPTAIQRRTIEGVPNGFNAAPIPDMRRYVALEKKEHKVLDQARYLLEFLSRAKEYLGGEFDIAVQEKRSIAGACAYKMNKRAWTASIKNHLAKQKAADMKRGSDTTDQRSTKRAIYSRDSENFK